MLLVVGLTVLMMMAASVTAEEDGETEAPIPDSRTTRDASNGERGVEDPLIDEHTLGSPYWDTDENVIIASNPGDMEDIMTDDSAADDDDTVMTAGLPVFGVLA